MPRNRHPNDDAFPEPDPGKITMSHGSGGRVMHDLIDNILIKNFDSEELKAAHDSAVINTSEGRYAFTTDSYVIDPLFFPGGDIGSLAVIGTVNDLAMAGAKPMYLSVGFIIEEGFEIELLEKIVKSMKNTADKTGVRIVTGDTKVVEHGKGDGLYINTAGVGILEHNLEISPSSITTGDTIIINRDIGCHGVAVMSRREGLQFETEIKSDMASLAETVSRLIEKGLRISCLRDLTRGGLASGVTELAHVTGLHFALDEKDIKVLTAVRNACEILGLDPIQVANEGTFIIFTSAEDAPTVLDLLNKELQWPDASIIGRVNASKMGLVTLKTILGTERIITMPSGEQLPRIC